MRLTWPLLAGSIALASAPLTLSAQETAPETPQDPAPSPDSAPLTAPTQVEEPSLRSAPPASPQGDPGEGELGPEDLKGEDADAEVEPFKPIGWGALPALNYNTDEGFGYGIIGRLYFYDEEKLDIQPYSKALTLRIFLTTKNLHAHLVELDALDVFDLPLRVRARASYYLTITENFCGVGHDVMCDEASALSSLTTQGVDPQDTAYDDALRLYYKQRYTEPYLWLDTRTKLKELPHKVELMASWRGSFYIPGTPENLPGPSKEPYPFDYSLLAQPEYAEYVADSTVSIVQAGVMFDNRDFETAPQTGYWAEVSARTAQGFIGSDYSYTGINGIYRFYRPILPEGKLVFANRTILDALWGDAPAAELTRVGGSQIMTSFGGQNVGRGIRSGRFVGRYKAFNQTELRWTFATLRPGENRLDLGTLFFFDAGHVAMDLEELKDFKLLYGLGTGLRITANRNFLVRLDVGMSPYEDWSPRVYINLDHLF